MKTQHELRIQNGWKPKIPIVQWVTLANLAQAEESLLGATGGPCSKESSPGQLPPQ